ncbi:MAG TPA: BlaI/MecI/CopY family transcriptional regulator [Candidatus Norongarragalinales archaeon]|nr:BlaI/MecI/CopY family transcriptional regulator [Candidatus Norongarragalinales archaeon]
MVKIKGFRFERQGSKAHGLDSVLSPLESKVLEVLCSCNEATVREVHKKLVGKCALTSVAVMLDRLHDKGLVTRKALLGRGGQHYIYSARASKRDLEYSVLDNAVNQLMKSFGHTAVSYFNERFKKA